jgi:hypothetical protein
VIQSLGLKPEEDAMAAPVPLGSDFDAQALRGLAKGSRDPAQTRRLLALSVIAAGGLRSEAAEIGGVGLQTVHDWVVALNADGPAGLIDGKAPGARPRLNADQRDALKVLVEQGPSNYPPPCAGWVSLIPSWDGSYRS